MYWGPLPLLDKLPRSQVEQIDHEWGILTAKMARLLEVGNLAGAEAIQTIEEGGKCNL